MPPKEGTGGTPEAALRPCPDVPAAIADAFRAKCGLSAALRLGILGSGCSVL